MFNYVRINDNILSLIIKYYIARLIAILGEDILFDFSMGFTLTFQIYSKINSP